MIFNVVFDYNEFMEMSDPDNAFLCRLTESFDYIYVGFNKEHALSVIDKFKTDKVILESISLDDKEYLRRTMQEHKKSGYKTSLKEMYKYFNDKYGNVDPTRYCLGSINLDFELEKMEEVFKKLCILSDASTESFLLSK